LHGIRVDRVTTDTDLGLEVADWAEFSHIREALLRSGHFLPDRRVEHKLIHRSGRALDVVPFGNIEDRRGAISWPPSGALTMSVVGDREGFAGSLALLLYADDEDAIVYAEAAHVVAAMMNDIVEKLDPLKVHACAKEPSIIDVEPTS
jgi:predicted nucleotidyltransferase